MTRHRMKPDHVTRNEEPCLSRSTPKGGGPFVDERQPMTVCREAPERRRTQQSNNKNTGETEISDGPDCRFGGIPEGNTSPNLATIKDNNFSKNQQSESFPSRREGRHYILLGALIVEEHTKLLLISKPVSFRPKYLLLASSNRCVSCGL